MSLIIKGMKLPYCCVVCPFKEMYNDGLLCKATKPHQYIPKFLHKRNEKCPLTEIPTPHGRLIDADYLINVLQDTIDNYPDNGNDGNAVEKLVVNVCKQYIEHCPTVIKAEVSE